MAIKQIVDAFLEGFTGGTLVERAEHPCFPKEMPFFKSTSDAALDSVLDNRFPDNPEMWPLAIPEPHALQIAEHRHFRAASSSGKFVSLACRSSDGKPFTIQVSLSSPEEYGGPISNALRRLRMLARLAITPEILDYMAIESDTHAPKKP